MRAALGHGPMGAASVTSWRFIMIVVFLLFGRSTIKLCLGEKYKEQLQSRYPQFFAEPVHLAGPTILAAAATTPPPHHHRQHHHDCLLPLLLLLLLLLLLYYY